MQTQKQKSANDRVWTGLPEASKRRTRTGIDEDLAWFLECGGYALSERGTLGGIIAQLERGGVGGGLPNTNLYDDDQIGWGEKRLDVDAIGLVERHRWLSTAWLAITPQSQGVLLARYALPPAELATAGKPITVRSDEGYGARDKFVDGAHPVGPRPIQPIGKRGKPIKRKQFEAQTARWERDARRFSEAASRTSVDSELGEFAALAIMLCPTPDKLVQACSSPSKANRELRDAAVKAAKAASEAAHADWLESKNGADPTRTRAQRVAVVVK